MRVPYVPDATKISGRRGIAVFRGTVAWYRTKIDVPVDGTYAIRFESVNHKAQVFIDGKRVAKHTGEYLPFEVKTFLKAGARHKLVVRADYRGPTAMKRDGWHRLWFNFGGINRGSASAGSAPASCCIRRCARGCRAVRRSSTWPSTSTTTARRARLR